MSAKNKGDWVEFRLSLGKALIGHEVDNKYLKTHNNKCTCGNPIYGFDCSCNHISDSQGKATYCCEFCGIYEASRPKCNKCEKDI